MTDDTDDESEGSARDRSVGSDDLEPGTGVDQDGVGPSTGDGSDDVNADADSPASEPRAGSGRPLVAVTGVLAVVVLALAALLVVLLNDRSDLQSAADRQDDISNVASAFGVALLSYDFNDVDASIEDVDPLATDRLRQELAEGYEGDLRAQIEQLQAVSTAEVLDILVSDTKGDTGRAVVVLETNVESSQSRARVTTFLDLSLLRVDGDWLVEDMKALRTEGGLVDEEGNPITPDPGEAPGSSTTTATSEPG